MVMAVAITFIFPLKMIKFPSKNPFTCSYDHLDHLPSNPHEYWANKMIIYDHLDDHLDHLLYVP